MIDIVLPKGWKSERCDRDRFTVITAPGIGAVTIDWRDRVFRIGMWFHGDAKMERYAGRGWRQRLAGHALAKLRVLGC